jgi:hypothetical protein
MKKSILFLSALLVVTLTTFAGGAVEQSKSQFQFVNIEATQNSWDYSYMHYNVKDQTTGDIIEVPSFLIKYEVKDKSGNIVATGKGAYVAVADNKLGSQEDYTISLSTMVNGQKVSESIERKASPKSVAIKLGSAGGDLASASFEYTFTRPKFNNPDAVEKIQLDPSAITVDVAVANNHIQLRNADDYKNLEKTIKSMTKGNKNVILEPSIAFKGESYKDSQNSYAANGNSIRAFDNDAAVADK